MPTLDTETAFSFADKVILRSAKGFSFFLSFEHLTIFVLNWCEITRALIM